MHVKEPSALIVKRKGFASVFLAGLAAYCTTAPCKPLHGAKDVLYLKLRPTPCSNNTWRFVSVGKGRVIMVIKYYYYYELPGWCQIGQQWYHTSPSLASLTRPVHTLLYNPINKIHSRGWLRWPLGGRVTFSQLRLNNAMVALTYLLPARPGLLFLPIAPSIVPLQYAGPPPLLEGDQHIGTIDGALRPSS